MGFTRLQTGALILQIFIFDKSFIEIIILPVVF